MAYFKLNLVTTKRVSKRYLCKGKPLITCQTVFGTRVADLFIIALRAMLNPMRYKEYSNGVRVVVESNMTDKNYRPRARFVIGPDGAPLTIADLPPQTTKRWVIRRKAEVVAAVRGGLLSLEEACERYKLTVEEFLSWQRSIDRHGLAGLRATRVQDYRGV